ncbi:MAG: SRPBCC domain-containing protein [Candidatus Thermoplasmatota archaeon]|nr:SRPBCC domain-containing protein [Candidatus Thermoplasmatota archaeon]MCL5794339.1 SRPBCC domain-containing protein [Candidatus Thermoplasmatota archaeon]
MLPLIFQGMTMKFNGSFAVTTQRHVAFERMSDPEFLITIIPDVVEAAKIDQHTIHAVIKAGLSFIKGKFRTSIILKNEVDDTALTVKGSGNGSGSSMDFLVNISLADDVSGTLVNWDAEINISGSAATLGQRMIDKAARNYVDRLIESFRKSLGEP